MRLGFFYVRLFIKDSLFLLMGTLAIIYNGDDMKSIYDIQQLLMKFGTVIYIGDRIADLELMEMEIRELYKSQFVSDQDFQMAILLLRQEISKVQKARGEG